MEERSMNEGRTKKEQMKNEGRPRGKEESQMKDIPRQCNYDTCMYFRSDKKNKKQILKGCGS